MSELARQSPKPKGKTVRIVSPHSATSSSDEGGNDNQDGLYPSSSGRKLFSPPPSATTTSGPRPFEGSPKGDPFTATSDGEDTSEGEDGASSEDEMEHPEPIKVQNPLSPAISALPTTTPHTPEVDDRRQTTTEPVYRASKAFVSSGQSVPFVPHPAQSVPLNPFQRSSGAAAENVPLSTRAEGLGRGSVSSKGFPILSNKTPLDVDAFTRLLLTGDKGSGISNPSTATFAASHGDSSSNTDASSLSRQSILDSQTDLRLETPRTSIEVSPKEEEQQYQFSSRSPKSERQGPPIPRSRSMKSKGNVSQTVAFGDTSIPRDSLPTIQTTNLARRSTAPSSGSSSDLNKPLPPPPASLDSPELERFEAALPPVFATSSSESLPTPSSRNKAGPLPPISRRHSQLRSKYVAPPQSGTSTSIVEEPMPAESRTHEKPPSTGYTKPAAPPPPPRRRGAANVDISQASQSAVSSETTSISDFVVAGTESAPSIPPPPQPISMPRHQLTSTPSPQPTPSTSTSASMPPPPSPSHSQSSGTSKIPPPMPPARHPSKKIARGSPRNSSSGSGTGLPPPPPPRRRASSGGSSLSGQSQRRFSQESARIEEESGGERMDRIGSGSASGSGAGDDILEEMERLRREIDEARGRYSVREEDM